MESSTAVSCSLETVQNDVFKLCIQLSLRCCYGENMKMIKHIYYNTRNICTWEKQTVLYSLPETDLVNWFINKCRMTKSFMENADESRAHDYEQNQPWIILLLGLNLWCWYVGGERTLHSFGCITALALTSPLFKIVIKNIKATDKKKMSVATLPLKRTISTLFCESF